MKVPFSMFVLFLLILSSACKTNKTNPVKTDILDSFSQFIVIDSANKMTNSYLTSIGSTHNDTDIQSLIIDVHQLRRYIDSIPASSSIAYLKLQFAHTLSVANSAQAGTNMGYKSNALTIIISAFNSSNSAVYYNGNMVLDYAQPCPPACPTTVTNH
ncbi:MAG TPA: hypothetical protein VHA56_12050 [Mucilaginibacter sp.]|nr:hypothetical protein [Mucilaginibacter sp.]